MTTFQKFLNHPAGPKTIHFWAPTMKWGLVIAGLGDLQRPADKLSLTQTGALAATGVIWSRYSMVITPKNWNLFSVNIFVGAVVCCLESISQRSQSFNKLAKRNNASQNLNGEKVMESREAAETGGSGRRLSSVMTARRIYANLTPHRPRSFTPNEVCTSKYSLLSFLPKNIIEQFHGLANFYFLGVIILQAFPEFSEVNIIIPTLPLVIIVLATAMKDGLEDLKRHNADDSVNNSPTYRMEGWTNVNHMHEISTSKGKDGKATTTTTLVEVSGILSFFKELFGGGGGGGGGKKGGGLKANIEKVIQFPPKIHSKDYISPAHPMDKAKLDHGTWNLSRWMDIKVGDFLLLRNNDRIPADVVILTTGEPDLMCYVETKNLDGETNLKIKRGIKEVANLLGPTDCQAIKFSLDAEAPNPNLYTFNGALNMEDGNVVPVGPSGLLLRGCVLRNTGWAIALVVYTGTDTKIMQNSGPTPSKRSKIDKQINPLVILNCFTLILICFICAICSGLYEGSFLYEKAGFLGASVSSFSTTVSTAFISFFNSLIVYQNIIPIALYISLEITKSFQSYLIYVDLDMYDAENDQSVMPKAWNLCDDLGQIEYVFSDKTGTLTSNMMDFKKASIGGISYGKWVDPSALTGDPVADEREKENLNKERELMTSRLGALFDLKYLDSNPGFIDAQLPLDIESDTDQSKRIKAFFSLLAICHTVLVEKPDDDHPNKIAYRAQSPDEAALVTAAKNVGFSCLQRNENKVEIDFMGTGRTYTILNILEFNSDRKRMSVVVLRPEGDILLFCKGADSVIYERLDDEDPINKDLMELTSSHLSKFANDGLRTLCLAYRRISKEDYDDWAAKYRVAQAAITEREKKCDEVADKIERGLTLMGATAIEDKLQDGVPESIALLAKAGIKLWVLTGDKVETAINIGFSCNLLRKTMVLIVIQSDSALKTIQQIKEALDRFWETDGRVKGGDHDFALVIDGASLKFGLQMPCKTLLLELSCRCKAVLCCRVSPLQKALVVKMVREGLGAMCLAIGDGANDVSMIQEADIGIGISGKEGLQAVMASDYAISQFRFLSKLLLVHGRWAYIRSAELVLNYFYKNITWLLILFWHQFFCGFSVELSMDYNYSIFFNTLFTILPTVLVGIFDQDINSKLSLELPQIYLIGITQQDFCVERFWIYMGHGLYQSLICYFGIFLMTSENSISQYGRDVDGSTFSTLLSCSSILIINLFGTSNWYSSTWINVFSFTASMSMWIIYLASYISTADNPPYGYVPSLSFFAVILVVVTLSLLPRLVIKFTQRLLWPTDRDIIQEYQNNMHKPTLGSDDGVLKSNKLNDSKTEGKPKGVQNHENSIFKIFKTNSASTASPTSLSSTHGNNTTAITNNITTPSNKITIPLKPPALDIPQYSKPTAQGSVLSPGGRPTECDGFQSPISTTTTTPFDSNELSPTSGHHPLGELKEVKSTESLKEELQKQPAPNPSPTYLQKAGFYLKKRLGVSPDRSKPGSANPSTGAAGTIFYMNGKRASAGVANTGFAFSQDTGMQDIITPLRLTLEPLPHDTQLLSVQGERKRFPSLVPDRIRQFSKSLQSKLSISGGSYHSHHTQAGVIATGKNVPVFNEPSSMSSSIPSSSSNPKALGKLSGSQDSLNLIKIKDDSPPNMGAVGSGKSTESMNGKKLGLIYAGKTKSQDSLHQAGVVMVGTPPQAGPASVASATPGSTRGMKKSTSTPLRLSNLDLNNNNNRDTDMK